MKRLAVIFFWGFCVLSWVSVLFLAVAFFCTPPEKENPWTPGNRTVPVPPRITSPSPVPVTWADSTTPIDPENSGFCSWGTPSDKESVAQQKARRLRFPYLCDEDRLDFVTLHCEIVYQYDQSGKKLREYVAPFDHRVKLEQESRPGRQTNEVSRHEVTSLTTEDVSCVKDPRDHTVYSFLSTRKSRIESRFNLPLPPDTPWEIPLLRYKKNLRGTYSGLWQRKSDFQTNNFGYASEDFVVPKPKGVFRILCLGGSTTEEQGELVSYPGEGSYPNRLQRLLRQRFPNRAIEVVNCGIGGKSSTDSVMLLPDYLLLEPDLFLMYDGVNDVIALAIERWCVNREPAQEGVPCILPVGEVIDQDMDSLTVRNFRAIARVARCRGVPVVLCSNAAPDVATLSQNERQYFSAQERGTPLTLADYCRCLGRLNGRIRRLCEREHMLYIPVHENMGGGFYYFYDFCHMLPRGIARKAEIISQYLGVYLAAVLDTSAETSVIPENRH